LCHMADIPQYDALVADTAALLGRNLEPWRAILAVAHWLTDKGIDGLADRMTTLAQAYQNERREPEPPDLTAWTIQALGNCCIKCASQPEADTELFAAASSASSASGASSAQREGPWIVPTETITEEVKGVLEEAQTDIKADTINSIRIGKVLKALRLEKPPQEKRGAARKWKITKDDLLTNFVTYGLDLPEEIFPKHPDTSQPDALDADQCDAPPASSDASREVENRGGLQTLDALDVLDDLMQATPSVQVHRNGISPATEPCRLCDGIERWNDGGIWRCIACYPPRAGVGSL
jgi:hypothetical protein